MFSSACVSSHATTMAAAMRTNGSLVAHATRIPAIAIAANSAITNSVPITPSSSPTRRR